MPIATMWGQDVMTDNSRQTAPHVLTQGAVRSRASLSALVAVIDAAALRFNMLVMVSEGIRWPDWLGRLLICGTTWHKACLIRPHRRKGVLSKTKRPVSESHALGIGMNTAYVCSLWLNAPVLLNFALGHRCMLLTYFTLENRDKKSGHSFALAAKPRRMRARPLFVTFPEYQCCPPPG